jgi:signal transduction histidine kinase
MLSGIACAEVHVRLAFNPRVTLFQLIKKGDPKSFMNKSKKRAHFKKERSSETVSTRLWEADDALFFETVNRRHTNPAELLRQIVHEWAITMRLSGQNTDQPETAGPIRKLQEQILAEQLEPINELLATICHRLNVPLSANANTHLVYANTQDAADPASDVDSVLLGLMRRVTEDMDTTLQKLSRLKMSIAHYNLSAQIFAANWTVLDFIRRDVVEPRLQTDPQYKDDASNTALVEAKENWNQALAIVKNLAFHFRSSELFYDVLPARIKAANGISRNQSSEDEAEAEAEDDEAEDEAVM